jgi:hypothetical protein
LDLQRALVQARELVYADPEGDTPEALLRWMADRWALLIRLAHEAEAVDPGSFGVLLGYVEGHLAGWPEVLWSRCGEDFADLDEAARWVEQLRGPVMDDVSLWLTATPTPPPSWRLLRFVDACPRQGKAVRPIQPSDLLGRFPLLPLTGAGLVAPESPKTFRKLLGVLRGARHLGLKVGSDASEGEDDPLAVFAKNAPEGLASLRLEGGEWTAQRARLLAGAGWWPRLRSLDVNMRSEVGGRVALMGEVLGRASALQSLALPVDWGHEEVFGLCYELALPTLRRLVVRPRESLDEPTGYGWQRRGPWWGEGAVWRADWRGALVFGGLRRLALADVGMCGEELADAMEAPWFGGLRALDLSLNPLGDLALEALATAPGGAALRELRLGATLDATSLSDIPNPYWFERRAELGEFDAVRDEDAQGAREDQGEEALEIEWGNARRWRAGQARPEGPRTRARAAAVGALWSGPALSGLVSLGLRDNFLTGGLDALAEPGPSLALGSLDLGRCRLWPQDLEALGRTRRLPALRRLRLDHNPRAWSEASARALGEGLVGLRALDLRGCGVPAELLERLGRSPLGESLEELVLDEEPSAELGAALWGGWRGLRCLRLQPSAPEPRVWATRAGRVSYEEEREHAYHRRYGFGRWYAPDEEAPLGLSALLPLASPDVMPCLELLVVGPGRPWDDLGALLEPRLVGPLRERGVVLLRGQPAAQTWAV